MSKYKRLSSGSELVRMTYEEKVAVTEAAIRFHEMIGDARSLRAAAVYRNTLERLKKEQETVQ